MKMKVVVIGNRGHNGFVVDSINAIPDIELAAISSGCEDDIGALRKRCNIAGVEDYEVFDDYRKMLDVVHPDIVCVTGPLELHAQMCIEAFRRNCHVLCEKPVAFTLKELDSLRQVWLDNNKPHFAAMVNYRYDPAFYTARQAVNVGLIGKIKLIQTRKSYKLGKRPDYYKTRSTYGGTIPWVGSHAIDWIYWFSQDEFDTVYAVQSNKDNFSNGEMEIAAQIQFTMKSGILASASLDFLRPAAAKTHGDDRIRLAGTEGVVEVIGKTVTLLGRGSAEQLKTACSTDLFSDFVNTIRTKTTPLIDAKQTFKTTEACLKAQLSADSGEKIFF